MSDFTYVAMWSGVAYVAFTIDAYSRRIVGWKADTNMKTELVLDTLEMALWARDHHGQPDGEGLVLRSDAGASSRRLRSHSASSTPVLTLDGSIGDAYDNALAETTIGLYKTELINRREPWKTIDQVELSTLEWVDWNNHGRLHTACEGLPPAEFEQARKKARAHTHTQ